MLELGTGELLLDMLRAALVRGHEGQIDLELLRGGERDLRFLGFFLDALHRIGLLAQVDAAVRFELGDDPIHDAMIPIVATQVGVAIGRLHFKDALADLQHGDIERAAAEIVHRDLFVLLLIQPVSQRSRGRLIDNAFHLQARDLARVLGRIAL